MITRGQAEQVVDAILDDLSDRRGLRQEFDGIDREIKVEIREKWINLAIHNSETRHVESPWWLKKEDTV